LPEIDITDYSPTEYAEMYLNPKEDIYVGINELVTADVLNRCFKQLLDTMNILVTHI
jgi:hypothetical protein